MKKQNQRPTETWLRGEPDGRPWLAWVHKRTYRIRNGKCELDDPGRQEVLHGAEISYDPKRKLPRVAPPIAVSDLFPFRARTDVVVQAFAHAYTPGARRLTVRLKAGELEREIVVFGDRFGDVDRFGRPCFSEPSPIELVPLRYDYAYGGADLGALAKYGDPLVGYLARQRPELPLLGDTAFHYPRNPTGLGYLLKLDEGFKGLPLPHLEHPFDPLTPERLAVGKTTRWIHGPLPAAWDWQSRGWFPRIAYLGLQPVCEDEGRPPAEVARGWAPSDILQVKPIFQAPDAPLRLEHGQAASPGMSVASLAPDERFELAGVHPDEPLYAFRLPGEVPTWKVALGPGEATELATHLSSVVVRPVPGEVVIVWSARAPMPPGLTLDKLVELSPKVEWKLVRKDR